MLAGCVSVFGKTLSPASDRYRLSAPFSMAALDICAHGSVHRQQLAASVASLLPADDWLAMALVQLSLIQLDVSAVFTDSLSNLISNSFVSL